MYNWSTDEDKLKKDYPEDYQKWRLLQLINYGLDGERIKLKLLQKLWPEIKSEVLDPKVKEFLENFVVLQ